MKNMIMVFISALMGLVTLAIVMTVYGRSNRSMEIKSSLPSAVEETVENLAQNPKYTIADREEYISDFIAELSAALDTESEVTVDVMGVNEEKGMMSICITETHLHPNGDEGSVSCERTVVLNRAEEEEPEIFTAGFYVEGELYKEYQVLEGGTVTAPADPVMESGTFHGWSDTSGYAADFTQPVTQDISYYAE